MITRTRTLSKIYIEAHEDSKSDFCAQLDRLNAPYERSNSLRVDAMWFVDGKAVMLDLKTPTDLIASATDGRLHTQCLSMERGNCLLHGFLIEGNATRDGITVGYSTHAWDFNRYENLLASLQAEGNIILHSATRERTAARLLSFYRWTGAAEHSKWREPLKPSVLGKRWYGDDDYRAHVEALMALPGMGLERAESLLEEFPFATLLDPAHTEELVRVDGIGKGLVTKWKAFLEADYS